MVDPRRTFCHHERGWPLEELMKFSTNLCLAVLAGALACGQSAFAQRRVFTNEDVPAATAPPPSAPAAPPAATAQPDSRESAAKPAEPPATATDNDKVAAAQNEVRRLMAIRDALSAASDVLFDKSREGNVEPARLANWNVMRSAITDAINEFSMFIEQASRSLPLNTPPPSGAAAPAQPPAR